MTQYQFVCRDAREHVSGAADEQFANERIALLWARRLLARHPCVEVYAGRTCVARLTTQRYFGRHRRGWARPKRSVWFKWPAWLAHR